MVTSDGSGRPSPLGARSRAILTAGVLLVVVACSARPPSGPTLPPASPAEAPAISVPPGMPESGVVDHVIDGDTLAVAGLGTVRLLGIDTPEVGECGFVDATQALEDLTLNREVRLVGAGRGPDRDKYGRLLRYVDVAGLDAGLALISSGLAVARYDSRDGYDFHPREPIYVSTDERTPAAC